MKMLFICGLLLQVSSVANAQDKGIKVTVAPWPQDRLSAISLTFDDAMNTHLDVARPILRKHHLTGTFFVSTARESWLNRRQEWQGLAEEGDELGNHTVNHPCLLEIIEPHSQSYTPAMMETEVRDAAQEIARMVHKQRGLTFAYPCGNMSFGPPDEQARNTALYMRYVAEHSFGARGAGGGGAQDPDEMSVLTVADLGPTAGKDFLGLLALAKPALKGHIWGVYCFHGIGGEWLSVTGDAFDELASYLERHSEIWTAPFGDVLRYIQERKATAIEIKKGSDTSVDLVLKWPMDAQIYDLPLTLRVAISGIWKGVTATGDGAKLNSKIIDQKEGTVILVDVPAQTMTVHIGSTTH
jgi:peptidoglycan/xylan/chitin deacetylase (PgdA/CDA1 family)